MPPPNRLIARFSLLFSSGLLCLLLAGCAIIRREHSVANPPSAEQTARLDRQLAELQQQHGVGNLSVGVVTPGSILYSYDSSAGSHAYHLASVSKLFTALAVLRAAEQGYLLLDDPLVKYDPAVPHAGRPAMRPVTFFDLLTHTSGFRAPESEQLVQVLPPGFDEHYLNQNYELLAAALENATGKAYPRLIDEYIFQPLGMRAGFINPPRKPEDLAEGAGRIHVSSRDMAAFVEALLAAPSPLLTSETGELFYRATVPGIDPPRHLAWNARHDRRGRLHELFHSGIDHSSGAELTLIPKRNIAWFILIDKRYSPELFAQIEQIIREQFHLAAPHEIKLEPISPKELAGNYISSAGEKISISAHNGISIILPDQSHRSLAPQGPRSYAAFDPELDDRLAAPLANAAGDLLEVIVKKNEIRGIVWKNVYYAKREAG